MPSMEDRRLIAELRLEVSAHDRKLADLRHKLVVLSCAIEAFADGTCETRIPLTPKQSRWVKESMEAAKALLPANLRIATLAAEKIAKRVAVLKVDLLPLFARLKEDIEVQIDRTATAREQAHKKIRAIEAVSR